MNKEQTFRGSWRPDVLSQSCQKCGTGASAAWTACAASGIGAGLMYLFDPTLGPRRRKTILNSFSGLFSGWGTAAQSGWTDLKNRSRGLMFGIRRLFTSGQAPDHVIEDRVRSRLGRYCSHPHAIQVCCDDGVVTLGGDCLALERDDIVKVAHATRGVVYVRDNLRTHHSAADFPALQGGTRPAGMPFNFAKDHWAPGTRLVLGAAGTGLMTWCIARRTLTAAALGTAGFALFIRAASNLPLRRLVGTGAGRRAIDIHKTININAPIHVVFGFWSNYDNFPLFMTNVRQVIDRGDGTSHWVVSGPAGSTVEWDAILTEYAPNRRIGWKTLPGAKVANTGFVRFDENPDGTTRVDINLQYNPPAGAIGHVVASAFGADPASQMSQDLLRMKTLIETGNFPHDAARRLEVGGSST